MTVTSLREIERAFVDWAEANDDIAGAFVVGSQARIDHPADAWADLDIIMFTSDVDRYASATDWLAGFAPVWIALAGRTVTGDPERLVLYEGGFQVDYVFNSSAMLAQVPQMLAAGQIPDIIRRGTRVLVDKSGVLADLPAPASLPASPPPTEAAFREALDNFWFSAVYCAKQLRRGELWMFQNGSVGMMGRLLQMTEWYTRATRGWEIDTWHGGKFVAEWAEPESYAALRDAFAGLDVADGLRAMGVRLALFDKEAREVAGRLGYPYPEALSAGITGYIDSL